MTANIDIRKVGAQVYASDESVPTPDSGKPLNDFLRQINQMLIFDPSLFDATAGGDFLNQLLSAATKLVTSSNPGIYRFFINPTNLQMNITKIVTQVLEKKGWETIHWPESPNQMITMAFSGTSGTMIPIRQLREQGVRDTKFSLNWMRFQQFQSLVLGATNDLKMLYDGKLYEGYVTGLQYVEDANNPFFIQYTFTFMAYPDRIKNIAAPNTLFNAVPLASVAAASGVAI